MEIEQITTNHVVWLLLVYNLWLHNYIRLHNYIKINCSMLIINAFWKKAASARIWSPMATFSPKLYETAALCWLGPLNKMHC